MPHLDQLVVTARWIGSFDDIVTASRIVHDVPAMVQVDRPETSRILPVCHGESAAAAPQFGLVRWILRKE
jgi:hypothetical protein